jgi:hypothetical protein
MLVDEKTFVFAGADADDIGGGYRVLVKISRIWAENERTAHHIHSSEAVRTCQCYCLTMVSFVHFTTCK